MRFSFRLLKLFFQKLRICLFFSICFFLFIFRVQAQSDFNSGGGDAAGSQVNVSYSIGQLFYEPFSYEDSIKVTPGVQQTVFIEVITSNEKINVSDINLYPNPVTDYVELLFKSEELPDDLKVKATLYDLAGNAIAIHSVDTPVTRIKTSALKQGVYLLKVTNGNAEIKTFKVIKK